MPMIMLSINIECPKIPVFKNKVKEGLINASLFAGLVVAGILFFQPIMAQSAKNEASFTIENYYKTKWGFADEFINLWKTNHYPLLKKAMENGDIISVGAEKSKLHSGEDTRWDFKV